jgi:hypothetical protein
MHDPATAYTAPDRIDTEMRALFRDQGVMIALSCEPREPAPLRP